MSIVAAMAALSQLALTAACGPPASFDGLVGGTKDASDEGDQTSPDTGAPLRPDDSLAPPRPIAPLTASWVSVTKPKFRWALLQGTTGVRLELCPTRACDKDTKTFDASGAELTLPEDLTPGLWFWRLHSKTAETFGTQASPARALLVRGGNLGKGAPVGTMFDLNGDGRPDLMTLVEYSNGFGLMPLLAGNDDLTSFLTGAEDPDAGAFGGSGLGLAKGEAQIGFSDVDGDGYVDFVYSDQFATDPPYLAVGFGASIGLDYTKTFATKVTTVPFGEIPFIAGAGDLDGDGYGDFVATTKKVAVAVFGTSTGPGASQFLLEIGDTPDGGFDAGPDAGDAAFGVEPTKPFAAVGAIDLNEDGFSDLAMAEPFSIDPLVLFRGSSDRVISGTFPTVVSTPHPVGASTMVSGDFDADGRSDVAFTTLSAGKPAVCVELAIELEAAAFVTCYVPDVTPAGFATSLAALDLDADGKDEVLASSTSSGVEILRLVAGQPALANQHFATDFGSMITTLHPGRPGPAKWAGLRSDGTSIAVFAGTNQVTTVEPPFDGKRFLRLR